METETTFPVAEHFVSPQGEGMFSGTLMQFVRLAGCTVGKQFTPEEKLLFEITNNYQTKCKSFANVEFACDTNYKASKYMTAKEIVQLAEDSGVRRICLTGGEPLMHKELRTLVYYLNTKRLKVHIETSGTIPLGPLFINPHRIWITVSPKAGYLIGEIRQNANEVKLLVDENMTDEILTKFVAELFPNLPKGVPFRESPIVWLQPINNENSIRQDNVQRCLNFMKKHTWMRLSLQLHKAIGAR